LGSILNLIAIVAGLVMHVKAPWYWAVVAAWVAGAGIAKVILRRFQRLPAGVRLAHHSRHLPAFTAIGNLAMMSPRLVELLDTCRSVHVLWHRQCLRHVQFSILLAAALAAALGWIGLAIGSIIGGLLFASVVSYQRRWKPSKQTQRAIAAHREIKTAASARSVAEFFLQDAGDSSAYIAAEAVEWFAHACEMQAGDFPMAQNLAAALIRLVERQSGKDRLIWNADTDRLLRQVTRHIVAYSVKLASNEHDMAAQANLREASRSARMALRQFYSQNGRVTPRG
jgi:hypothetical protein